MAFGSDDIALLFRAKGDTSDAKKAFNDLKGSITKDVGDIEGKAGASFEGLSQKMGLSTESAGLLSTAMGPVGIAIGAVAAVATVTAGVVAGLTEKLLSMAESASEYGSKIHDAADQTGLSAETISALKYAADTSNSSLEKITGSVAKFSTLLGQAEAGNAKAQATLKQYGITATDTNEALGQAVKVIASMTDSTQQSAAAAALFRDRTGEILPVIKSFNGDLPALMDKLREMGLLMSDKDAAAADAFGDQLDTLKMQLEAISRTIGMQVMPIFLEFFTSLSNWITQNQVYIKAFAISVGDAMTAIINHVKTAWRFLQIMAAVGTGNWVQASILLSIPLSGQQGPQEAAAMPSVASPGPAGGAKGGGKSSAANDAAKEAERQRQADAKAEMDLLELRLKQYEEAYKATLTRIRDEFKKDGDPVKLVKLADDALTTFHNSTNSAINDLFEKQFSAAGALSDIQSQLLESQQKERVEKVNGFIKDEVDKTNKLVTDSAEAQKNQVIKIDEDLTRRTEQLNRQRTESFLKDLEDQWDTAIDNEEGNLGRQNDLRTDAMLEIEGQYQIQHDAELARIDDEYAAEKDKIQKTVRDEDAKFKLLAELDELYKQQRLVSDEDFQKKKKEIEDKYAIQVGGDDNKGPFDALAESWKRFREELQKSVGLVNIVNTIGQAGIQMANNLTNAVGNAIEGWALYGDSVGQALRKALAAELAHLAALAVVKAIQATALGFFLLASLDFAGAAHAFTSAALWAALGGAAAIGARAVAGNSFKQQTTGAYGSATKASSGSANGGSVFSSQSDEVIYQNRNTPGQLATFKSEITLRVPKGWMVDHMKEDVKNNGEIRTLILDTAAG